MSMRHGSLGVAAGQPLLHGALARSKARLPGPQYRRRQPRPTEIATPGDVVVQNFSVARLSGTLAIMKADPTSTEDVYVVDADAARGAYQQLTEVNPQMRTWKLPQIKLVQWQGGDGDNVEGLLELPPGYRDGDKRLPMVLEIHGGPTADTPYCLRTTGSMATWHLPPRASAAEPELSRLCGLRR